MYEYTACFHLLASHESDLKEGDTKADDPQYHGRYLAENDGEQIYDEPGA